MFDRYRCVLTLRRPMLGTNPLDPKVLDQHIIQRQRKLITDNNQVNTLVNKYKDALQISDERRDKEINALLDKLEAIAGRPLDTDERKQLLAGDLDQLVETFTELETKGTTVFFWNKEKQRPMIGDHMIKGNLKAAGEAICRTRERKNGKVLHSIAHTQSLINIHVFIEEPFITFDQDIIRAPDGEPMYEQRSLRAKTMQGDRVALVKSEVVPAGAKLEFTLKVMKNSEVTEEVLRTLLSYGEVYGLGQNRNSGFGSYNYKLEKIG